MGVLRHLFKSQCHPWILLGDAILICIQHIMVLFCNNTSHSILRSFQVFYIQTGRVILVFLPADVYIGFRWSYIVFTSAVSCCQEKDLLLPFVPGCRSRYLSLPWQSDPIETDTLPSFLCMETEQTTVWLFIYSSNSDRQEWAFFFLWQLICGPCWGRV